MARILYGHAKRDAESQADFTSQKSCTFTAMTQD